MTWSISGGTSASNATTTFVSGWNDLWYDPAHPRRVGGVAAFSTCLDLMAPWRAVFDVNGYYRELGVPVTATRREIREAYQRKQGWLSERLTYIVAQLLDREVRAKYDSARMGQIFIDQYVQRWIRMEQIKQATEMFRLGQISQEDWEQQRLMEPPAREESSRDGENLSGSAATVFFSDEWPWGFYLWGTLCADRERLREWQGLLIEAFSETKEVLEIAVGFSGDMAFPWGVEKVGYLMVVFLNEHEQPTEALARQAASRAIEQARR